MIPELTKQTIDNYVTHRLRPGGFVTVVLANDLTSAVLKADSFNRSALVDIVNYVFNEVPRNCWGSYEVVEKYLEKDS